AQALRWETSERAAVKFPLPLERVRVRDLRRPGPHPSALPEGEGEGERALMTTKLSPTEIFSGRKIFLIGGTGFVGKVTLSMLLHRFPNIGRVYVTVRARSQEESETRFWNNVISAEPFDPVRERYGAAFEEFVRDKVAIVGGDIAEDNLGFSEEEAEELAKETDVVINSAGHAAF